MNSIIQGLMDQGYSEEDATDIYFRDYYTPPSMPVSRPVAQAVTTPMMRYVAPPPPDGITPNISGWVQPALTASPVGAIRPSTSQPASQRRAQGRRTAAKRTVARQTQAPVVPPRGSAVPGNWSTADDYGMVPSYQTLPPELQSMPSHGGTRVVPTERLFNSEFFGEEVTDLSADQIARQNEYNAAIAKAQQEGRGADAMALMLERDSDAYMFLPLPAAARGAAALGRFALGAASRARGPQPIEGEVVNAYPPQVVGIPGVDAPIEGNFVVQPPMLSGPGALPFEQPGFLNMQSRAGLGYSIRPPYTGPSQPPIPMSGPGATIYVKPNGVASYANPTPRSVPARTYMRRYDWR